MKYDYDPDKAKQLLQQAGLTLPVQIDFWYPTGVSRPYMPDPQRNFQVFAASLEKSGFKVDPNSEPWRPDYLGRQRRNRGTLNMLGWTGDYGDPDNFLGIFFGRTRSSGSTTTRCYTMLEAALQRDELRQAHRDLPAGEQDIMKDILPGVPYAHTRPALALPEDCQGLHRRARR